MNKNQFNSYIESFNKKPGEYTEEEIYQIGLKHKELPLKEKSWKDLISKLGWKKSTDSLRKFIHRRQAKEKLISEFVDKKNSNIEDNKTSELAENYKMKTQIRDVYNAYRRNLRDEARIETLKEFIKECTENLPNIYVEKYAGIKGEELTSEAVLMLSDLHIGVECHNFYNNYNLSIARKRLAKLSTYINIYCRKNNVRRLNICNLGDMIHGIIHVSARLEQQFDVIDQTIKAAELLSEFLSNISNAAPEIIYRSVVDNHSRIIANKNEHIEKENLCRILDWYLESRLNAFDIKFVHDNLDAGLGKFKLMNGKNVVFVHGHQDTIDKSLQNFAGATEEFIHYALLGHYHSEKMKSFQGIKVYCNGSIVGTEQYALGRRLFNKPSQTLLIFDDINNVINISVDLDIQD